MCSGACLHPWGTAEWVEGIQKLAHLCMGGKVSPLPLGLGNNQDFWSGGDAFIPRCGVQGRWLQHFFVMSILLPQRENSVVGIFLFPFPVSVFKWKVKGHYLQTNHVYLVLLLCQERGHSLSLRESDLFCPQTCSHKESKLFSPIDIDWFHCGLSRYQDFQ